MLAPNTPSPSLMPPNDFLGAESCSMDTRTARPSRLEMLSRKLEIKFDPSLPFLDFCETLGSYIPLDGRAIGFPA